MKLTEANAYQIVIGSVFSPFIMCVIVALLGQTAEAITFATVYSVFGLFTVLVLGWLLTKFFAQKTRHPLRWMVIVYSTLPLLISIAMLVAALAT